MMDRILELYNMENPPRHRNISSGLYNGFEYFILWFAGHPNAYIKIPEHHPFFGKMYDEIDDGGIVHYGFTFSGENLSKKYGLEDGWYLGWDYGHVSDYISCSYGIKYEGWRWTVEAITSECRTVIDKVIIGGKNERVKVQSVEEGE